MIREETKNDDELKKTKEKDDSHHSQQYDIDDDLENFVVKVPRKDSDDLSHSLLSRNKNSKEHFITTTQNKGFDIKNVLNVISLIALFSTCISSLLYFAIIKEDVYQFYDFFKTNTIHLQIKFEVFLTCWIIIIITLFLSTLRHCFYFTGDIYEIFYIIKINIGRIRSFPRLCLRTRIVLFRFRAVLHYITLDSTLPRPWHGRVRFGYRIRTVRFWFGGKFAERGVKTNVLNAMFVILRM